MAITCDMHIDLPWVLWKAHHHKNKGVDPAVSISKMRQGGLQCAFMALYLGDATQDSLGIDKSTQALYWQVEAIKKQGFSIADNCDDVRQIVNSGGVPVFFGLEGGRLITNSDGKPDLAKLAVLWNMGVTYFSFTHNYTTGWCDSATDTARHNGLSKTAHNVVQHCNAVGILIDISHVSDFAAWDILGLSKRPVIASHSGCRKLENRVRNLGDELIKAVVAGGGIVCVPFADRFVGAKYRVADHIDHIVQLTGSATNVGVGSDLDGAEMVPECPDAAHWGVVLASLYGRGYPEEAVELIAGENILRVVGAVVK